MDSGAIRMFFMGVVGILLIVAGITGNVGSMLAAIFNPEAMNDVSQATPGTFSFGVSATGTNIPLSTGTNVSVPGTVTDWLTQAIRLTGVPMNWLANLQVIALHESSGNPTVVNGNDRTKGGGSQTVIGLMQMLQTTFNAHALPGHTNILNPVDNAAAAIGYIQGRYGTVFNVPGIVSLSRGGPYIGY